MTNGFPLLSLITFLPLLGIAAILLPGDGELDRSAATRRIALATSLAMLALSVFLWIGIYSGSFLGFCQVSLGMAIRQYEAVLVAARLAGL